MTGLAQAQERISHLEVENDQLRLQVRELKAQIYGPKSEKAPSPGPARRSSGRKKGPKPLPAHLRREHVAVPDPDLGQLICPATGELMKPGFQQTIEVLARKPAEHYVLA